MKIILLLCFIVGAFCFAAKDALDARTTPYAQKEQGRTITLNFEPAAGAQHV